MTWSVPSKRGRKHPVYHVTPRDDLYVHVLDSKGSCWCCPERDDDDPEGTIYVHNAYDCREQYEDGRRQPH